MEFGVVWEYASTLSIGLTLFKLQTELKKYIYISAKTHIVAS